MKVKLQFGVDHAKEVGATHHRRGDLYKVTSRVECWDCGEWVDVDHPLKVSEWLEELETINWSEFE